MSGYIVANLALHSITIQPPTWPSNYTEATNLQLYTRAHSNQGQDSRQGRNMALCITHKHVTYIVITRGNGLCKDMYTDHRLYYHYKGLHVYNYTCICIILTVEHIPSVI